MNRLATSGIILALFAILTAACTPTTRPPTPTGTATQGSRATGRLQHKPTRATSSTKALGTHTQLAEKSDWQCDSSGSSGMFIKNVGQFNKDALFQMRSRTETIWLTENNIWVTAVEPLATSNQNAGNVLYNGARFRLSFPNANSHPRIEPFGRLETSINYFIGNDPTKWRSGVPTYVGVRYVDLYPGVDLELCGRGGQWAWRMVAHSPMGRDDALQDIRLRIEGADSLALDNDVLRSTNAAGEFTLPLLAVEGLQTKASSLEHTRIQRIRAQTFAVSSPFLPSSLLPGSPAPPHPSPSPQTALLYSRAFLSGGSRVNGNGIAVDRTGVAYITGTSWKSEFPDTPGPLDTYYNDDATDVFVIKLNNTGSAIAYVTFFGGSRSEGGSSIAVDGSGAPFVVGGTSSSDFPATPGAYDTVCDDWVCSDVFVVRLNPDGTKLDYATYVGGKGLDEGNDVALDKAGNIYVVGKSCYGGFPTTRGAFDTRYNGGGSIHNCGDAFVFKLNASGTSLVYSTYLGGKNADTGSGIVVDGVGNAYVIGSTRSASFPTTPGAFDTDCGDDGQCNEDLSTSLGYGGPDDVFVVKLNASGTDLIYATFLGGSDLDKGASIAVDEEGSVYLTGYTFSYNFPTTGGAADKTCGTDGRCNLGKDQYGRPNTKSDAFIAKLNPFGVNLIYSTFLGGSNVERASDIALDRAGNAYLTGTTLSADFPTTEQSFDTSYNGGSDYDGDAYVVRLNAKGTALDYATFMGGKGEDSGNSIAVDEASHAYVTGDIAPTDFPTMKKVFAAKLAFNGKVSDTSSSIPTGGSPQPISTPASHSSVTGPVPHRTLHPLPAPTSTLAMPPTVTKLPTPHPTATRVAVRKPAGKWAKVTSPTNMPLYSLFMVSADEGWAIGEVFLHYSNGKWEEIPKPEVDWTGAFLETIDMTSTDEGWGVGANILGHYTNGHWQLSVLDRRIDLFSVSMVSPDDGWIVGGDTILHYNGESWQPVAVPSIPDLVLYAIDMVSADEGWAMGERGVILHYHDGRWQQAPSPTHLRYYALDMVSEDEGWAVGDDLYQANPILHYSHGSWKVASKPFGWLGSVNMISSEEGWAVGSFGKILHYTGGTWQEVDSPTKEYLHQVDMVSPDEGWAVGENGTILHYKR